MSRQTTKTVFLEKAGYRKRRLRDAAKLVPFLGIVLLAIPLAWSGAAPHESIGSSGLLYVFGVWLLLIVLAAMFSIWMRSDPDTDGQDRDAR
jgi:formate hydrogenlyase subunit 3/multisubunit Na+/H+ antiporter MnhD subunit